MEYLKIDVEKEARWQKLRRLESKSADFAEVTPLESCGFLSPFSDEKKSLPWREQIHQSAMTLMFISSRGKGTSKFALPIPWWEILLRTQTWIETIRSSIIPVLTAGYPSWLQVIASIWDCWDLQSFLRRTFSWLDLSYVILTSWGPSIERETALFTTQLFTFFLGWIAWGPKFLIELPNKDL